MDRQQIDMKTLPKYYAVTRKLLLYLDIYFRPAIEHSFVWVKSNIRF